MRHEYQFELWQTFFEGTEKFSHASSNSNACVCRMPDVFLFVEAPLVPLDGQFVCVLELKLDWNGMELKKLTNFALKASVSYPQSEPSKAHRDLWGS